MHLWQFVYLNPCVSCVDPVSCRCLSHPCRLQGQVVTSVAGGAEHSVVATKDGQVRSGGKARGDDEACFATLKAVLSFLVQQSV